ncbi:MAG: TraR/DksA C4-type zinc finger protein [Bacteroidales bacterium]|nr:TraR/DksA C4-type zinc finger protein [Bacteroidales bacterium]MDY0215726.1 TraR/DksA C4-type zinc finger protein [Bacteroidales bacterium]
MEEKNRSRYSDTELEEFKNLIISKIEKSRLDLQTITESYSNTGNNDTMDTSPTFKILEEGHQVMSKEENSRLAARLHKYIQNLEAALIRIENKTYGVCRETGELIPKERLRAVPHATLSFDAKIQQGEKKQ